MWTTSLNRVANSSYGPAVSHVPPMSVEQAGAPGPVAPFHFVDDQARVLEHGQVLAHGVVVEGDERGELGDTHLSSGIRDVTEDPMARRIAEGAGLALAPVR